VSADCGYLRPTSQYNDAKLEEHKEKKYYKIKDEPDEK